MIFAQKISKIPSFCMIFARKIPEFYIIIARKIFFHNFRDGGGAPCPPSPTPMGKRRIEYRYFEVYGRLSCTKIKCVKIINCTIFALLLYAESF